MAINRYFLRACQLLCRWELTNEHTSRSELIQNIISKCLDLAKESKSHGQEQENNEFAKDVKWIRTEFLENGRPMKYLGNINAIHLTN